MTMKRLPWQAGVLSFLALPLGCGSPSTYTITGTVTLDGQLVEQGEILFVPIEKDQAPDSGLITKGTYTVQVKAGPKQVEIRAVREVPEKRTPMGPVFLDYIPEEYNKHSHLTAEITAGGKKKWDFHLTTESKP
jgi:hypothetical protein